MTAFPTLTPSSRVFTLGDYSHAALRAMAGTQTQVRHSNVVVAAGLELQFLGRSEADMLLIRSHYINRRGTFGVFTLPSAIWISTIDPTPPSYTWRYTEMPRVSEDGNGHYDIAVKMEMMPPDPSGSIASTQDGVILVPISIIAIRGLAPEAVGQFVIANATAQGSAVNATVGVAAGGATGGSSGDADALDYISRVEAVSGNASLEAGVKTAYTDFIVGLKADGNWTALDGATCILMGAKNRNGAIIPLKSSMPTQALAGGNTFPSSGDYNRETGLLANQIGTGQKDHIRTGVNVNRTGSENGNHLCLRIRQYEEDIGGLQNLMGGKNQSLNLFNNPYAGSSNMSTTQSVWVGGTAEDFHQFGTRVDCQYTLLSNRTSNTQFSLHEDNAGSQASTTFTVTGTNPGTANLAVVFTSNENTTGSYSTTASDGDYIRANFYSIGSTLPDPAAFMTRIAALEAAIAAALP